MFEVVVPKISNRIICIIVYHNGLSVYSVSDIFSIYHNILRSWMMIYDDILKWMIRSYHINSYDISRYFIHFIMVYHGTLVYHHLSRGRFGSTSIGSHRRIAACLRRWMLAGLPPVRPGWSQTCVLGPPKRCLSLCSCVLKEYMF